MMVSIIICTFNRAQSLKETLVAIENLRVPKGMHCELLIVDNASTDNTRHIIESAMLLSQISMRYIYEPIKGLSNARNRGMAEAQGDILLWTDDDVRPPQDWIKSMCAPILSGRADAVVGGIKMAPHLKREWMTRLHKEWLLEYDFSQEKEPGVIIGANCSFSKQVLKQVPAFDTNLGGGGLGFSDDVLFSWQIQKAGFKIASADSFVEHHFDPSRLLRESLLDRSIKEGHCTAYLAYHWLHNDIKYPIAKRIAKKCLLSFWRLLKGKECVSIEGCPEWELELVRDISSYGYFIQERKKPRNYEKQGLTKIA